MAGYQPEKHFFYSPMIFDYDFCLQEDNAQGPSCARRLPSASHRLSLTAQGSIAADWRHFHQYPLSPDA